MMRDRKRGAFGETSLVHSLSLSLFLSWFSWFFKTASFCKHMHQRIEKSLGWFFAQQPAIVCNFRIQLSPIQRIMLLKWGEWHRRM